MHVLTVLHYAIRHFNSRLLNVLSSPTATKCGSGCQLNFVESNASRVNMDESESQQMNIHAIDHSLADCPWNIATCNPSMVIHS